jgi:hypothetical protein
MTKQIKIDMEQAYKVSQAIMDLSNFLGGMFSKSQRKQLAFQGLRHIDHLECLIDYLEEIYSGVERRREDKAA